MCHSGGADTWEEVKAFGEAGLAEAVPALPNGIPSHDTFYWVFARLGPEAFGRCVADRMSDVCEAAGLKHIAVDGKAVRSAPRSTFSGCLHLVSAWAAESRLFPGQRAVAAVS